MTVGELTNDELLAIVRQRHSAMTKAIMDLPLFTALVDDAMPYNAG